MKMIVGLGNPGRKYEKTKHNMGFLTIDELAKRHQVNVSTKDFEAEYGTYFENGEKVFLVKPQTYMNDSGRAVRLLMGYYQIQLDELLVIQDDMDLKLGKVRLRQKGSAGGHNGIKSIINTLGTNEFKRIKIGIQHPKDVSVVDWVLTPFSKDERPIMQAAIEKAADAVDDWVETDDFMKTMNRFN